MTIPNYNYKVYKNSIDNLNSDHVKEDKKYCHKLQDALFLCREKNTSGYPKEKCKKLDKFIESLDCYNPYK